MVEALKSIVMMGCFDTKGEVYSFMYKCIKSEGENLITINTGVMQTSVDFPIDFDSDVIASAAGHSLAELKENNDRGYAVKIMGDGAANVLATLVTEKKIKAAIGMGGGGGTYITLFAMQQIPLGIPKLCLSTLTGKDLSQQLGCKDITLMPSIVDIAGMNSISKLLIRQAATAICAMSNIINNSNQHSHGRIAISMFGNTSACVDRCSELLRLKGYEVFPFHANGLGGKTMEALTHEDCFDAVLDITTTELADELCGGICSAGSDRLTAASKKNIVQVVVPGCLDMVNFEALPTVPNKYKNRELYCWSPFVTLMRTNEDENEELGKMLAEKVNQSTVPAAIVLPLKGISQVDSEGSIFYRPEIDEVLFKSIKQHTNNTIRVIEIDAHINDENFSLALVDVLMSMMKSKRNNI